VTDAAVAELTSEIGVRAACYAVGAAQAGYYRRHRISPVPARPAPLAHRDRPQPRALTEHEQHKILDVLHAPRFVDVAPAEVWATLLDEGRYLASISTFDRLLRRAGETRERRRQASHPARVKPELVATAPNQVWSSRHHQAARAGEVGLLPPIRDLGHLLPVRGRLDGRAPGIGGAGRSPDPPDLRQAGHRP
jgi:putative transposase